MTDENDPLDGAAIGETRTVRETVDLPVINFEPDVFYKSDRMGRSEVADVKITEDEDGYECVRVTFEGELTKTLPRNWDRPITEHPKNWTPEPPTRRGRIKHAGIQTVAFFAPVAVVLGVGVAIMRRMEPVEITVNGETTQMFPASVGELAPVVAIVAIIAFITWVGVNGGFPGRINGGRA